MKKIKLLILSTAMMLSCGIASAFIFWGIPNAPLFNYWNIEGCLGEMPIHVLKGETREMHIGYSTPHEVTQLKIEATLTMMGVSVTYPLDDCVLEPGTPIQEGAFAAVRIYFYVLKSLPVGLSSVLTIKILDQNKNILGAGAVELYVKE